jgi:hypothetical protein
MRAEVEFFLSGTRIDSESNTFHTTVHPQIRVGQKVFLKLLIWIGEKRGYFKRQVSTVLGYVMQELYLNPMQNPSYRVFLHGN